MLKQELVLCHYKVEWLWLNENFFEDGEERVWVEVEKAGHELLICEETNYVHHVVAPTGCG